MKSKSIKGKVLLLLSLMLVLIVAVLGYMTFSSYTNSQQDAKDDLESSINLLNDLVLGRVNQAKGLATMLSSDEDISHMFVSNDMNGLYQYADALYANLSSTMSLSVLEFGDKNGTVIYRAHNPEKKGDSKADVPAIASTLAGSSIAGTESGSSGIAIRAFAPIKKGNQVIGTVQVGFSNAFFEEYARVSFAYVDVYGLEGLLFSTLDEHEALLGKKFNEINGDLANQMATVISGQTLEANTSDYISQFIPVTEPVAGKVIGAFHVIYPLDSMNGRLMTMFITNGIATLVLMAFIAFLIININQTVSLPITNYTGMVVNMSQNNFLPITHPNPKLLERIDETGKLAQAVHVLSINIRQVLSSIKAATGHMDQQSQALLAEAAHGSTTLAEVNVGFGEFAQAIQEQAKDVAESVENLQLLSKQLDQNKELSNHIRQSSKRIESHSIDSEQQIQLMTSAF